MAYKDKYQSFAFVYVDVPKLLKENHLEMLKEKLILLSALKNKPKK